MNKHPQPLSQASIEERIEAMETAGQIGGVVHLSDVSLTPDMRARLAFEERRGVPYSDAEWREAKRNLVAAMIIGIELLQEREQRR